jgi:glutamate-5-semialdehyde dehydrogenase
MDIKQEVLQKAQSAYAAAAALRVASDEQRNTALVAMAAKIRSSVDEIKAANEADMTAGAQMGLTEAMLDRLELTDSRIEDMAVGLDQVAGFDDPVGTVLEETVRPNGLNLQRISVPIGVIGIVYESRPNVTVDAAGLCIKSGNCALLRGGKEAVHSNILLAKMFAEACVEAGLPTGCVEIIESTDRQGVQEMIRMDEYVSLIVPRGGHGLIRAVVENASVPVLKHDRGLCNIYVDANCDVARAVECINNAKTQRPGTCNAVENIWVHKDNIPALKAIVADLQASEVEVRGTDAVQAECQGVNPATEEDFDTEYLDMIVSVDIVDAVDEAIANIQKYSSAHSEAVFTDDADVAKKFLSEIDSACLYHNASTRFTDGGQFGMGAEIGISTNRLHARGPVGVRELTTYKYIGVGDYLSRD